jgi:ADP-ribose pyrophosphatase
MPSPVIIERKTLLSTPWLEVAARVVRGMPGSAGDQEFYVVRPRDYVSVVATTTEGDLLLVRQYRPAIDRVTLELPSGLLDPGETPENTARRELHEETGYVAGAVEHLGTLLPDTGRYENRLWCYYAEGVTPDPAWQLPDDGVERTTVGVPDLFAMMLSGEFDHALHLAVVMLAVARGRLAALRTPGI